MRLLKFFSLLLLPLAAFAQTNEEIAERIKNDKTYVFGEGFGETFTEADANALDNLTSKIAINLNHTFTLSESQKSSGDDVTSESNAQSIVNSYSQATLTNTESISLGEEPNAHVVRYIAKSEIEKIFAQRKDKVEDFIRSAKKADGKSKVDDALRYYYWAFTLLKSLQYPNQVTYNDNGTDRVLISWIPEQINEILDNMDVRVTDAKENQATLYFTYNSEPARSVDFTFFNGNSWTMLNSAKDGMAMIDLRPGVDVSTLKIRYEYEYVGEAHIDPELESVIKLFKGTYFKKSQVQLSPTATNLKNLVSKEAKVEMAKQVTASADIMIEEAKNQKEYNKVVDNIIKGLYKNDFASLQEFFTPEGWDMMDKLLHYGQAKMIGDKQEYAFFDLPGDKKVCRSLKMSFSFPNNRKTFTEDVVFTFDSNKKIECVAFGLGSEAKADIFSKGVGVWDDNSKMAIVNFLENYKTAFALKRLDYIESIFDDNAVIITGHVIKKADTKRSDGQMAVGGDIVQYNRYTKSEYVNKLRRTFASNQFVNIHFSDNDLVKMGTGGETYGIQLHQDYYSSNYGDTGYLYLMIDINNPDEPIIKVRTWQPERDPNINGNLPRNHPDFGIIGPGNF